MEGYHLPSPIPPAHLRNEKSFHTSSVQRPVGNHPRGPHGRDTRSPGPGHRSRSSHKINSPKIGYSQSHSQGLSISRPTSPSPTRIPPVVPPRARSPHPMRQLTFVQDSDQAQQTPEVIIPRATRLDQNKKVSTTVVSRSHSHHPDHSSRFPGSQRSGEDDDHHRSRSQQRTWSTEPESDFSPERSGSRQGFVHRFTTRIPSRPRSRPSRAPTPVTLEPSIYPGTSDKQLSEPPSSECLTGDELNQVSIQRASDGKQTFQSDGEDHASQEGKVTANLDHRLVADVKMERIRSVKDWDRRIRLLEDELAAVRRELENERQRRMKLELQAQTQQREKQSRMVQTDSPNQAISDHQGDIYSRKEFGNVQLVEKQDRHRKEQEAKWNELQSDVKKVQEVLAEIRGKVERTNIEAESKPGMEKAIEEFRRENAEQRELLNSLSQSWRADSARRQDENFNLQEKTPVDAQTYLDNFSKPLASEALMLLSEVGKLREERRALQHELGSLLCMKSKYGPGGEFDPDWTPPLPESSTVPPPPEPHIPPDLPQHTKLTWRTVYPKLGRTKKKESMPVT